MPKRINNIYDKSLTFSAIRSAYFRTAKCKKRKSDRIKFGMYLEDNILDIYKKLKSQTYTVGKYNIFKVYEPKEREIHSLPFYDRVVQQFYVYEYIIPHMIPKFISDSYACIPGKGLHQCVINLQKKIRIASRIWEKPYFVKYDISKFFYSINRDILYKIMEKHYKDKKVLNLTKIFLNSNVETEKGIPIGNYTSQYFANIYMNELDHYIKENLRVKYYIRFMDDGILIVENKEKAKQILEKITKFTKEKLDLNLNKKSGYFPVKNGCIFCGYRIYNDYKLIKRANIIRVRKRIKGWNRQWQKGNYDFDKWNQSFNAWRGYSMHADSYRLIEKLRKEMKFLY